MLRIARYRTAWHCLLAGIVGLAVPKCFLCLAGWAALAGLGWAGPELCGGARQDQVPMVVGAVTATLAVVAVYDRRVRKCRRS